MGDYPAYEIRDGRAVPCEWTGLHKQKVIAPAPLRAWDFQRERAQAIATAIVQALLWPLLAEHERSPLFGVTFPGAFADVEVHCAHRLSDGVRSVWLYLPDGESLTETHCRAVTHALRAN